MTRPLGLTSDITLTYPRILPTERMIVELYHGHWESGALEYTDKDVLCSTHVGC